MARRNPRSPRAHWGVLVVCLVVVFFLLLVSGLTTGQVGENAHEPAAAPGTGAVPRQVLDGGPIVDPSRPEDAGARVPDGHVVLTFDDGPTQWTVPILHVLAEHGVRATFFVVGSRVAERPDLLRRMVADGHEIGVHTFTHANLAAVPAWRERLELDQTQLAIAGATGRTTNLLRLPYSSQVDAITPTDWAALRRAGNVRAVFTDLDTRDWAKPGVARVVAAGLPRGRAGAVVMLHDGGGSRAETVAALGRLITDLQQRGYTFDTVTSAIGVPSPWH